MRYERHEVFKTLLIDYLVLSEGRVIYTPYRSMLGIYFTFLKFKQSIRSIKHDFHMKIYSKTKFYIYMFLLFFQIGRKSLFSDGSKFLDRESSDFLPT